MALAVLTLLACRNPMREELFPRDAEPIGSLREWGQRERLELANEAARIDNSAEIERLTAEINRQIAAIDDIIDRNLRLSRTQTMLGLRFMESFMYADAARAFTRAIEIDPFNANLHYQRALALGQVALTHTNDELIWQNRTEAKRSLEVAVQLNENHLDALYALAITYAYFFEDFPAARAVLNRLVPQVRPNTELMFVQAHVAAGLGNFNEAATLLNNIIATSSDEAVVARARANRETALAAMR